MKGSVPSSTTDGVMLLTGAVFLAAGTYSLKVNADDGYFIKVDGQVVAQYDGIQSTTERVHDTFTLDSDGYHSVEIVYWDQGGNAVLDIAIGQYEDGALVGTSLHCLMRQCWAMNSAWFKMAVSRLTHLSCWRTTLIQMVIH